MKNIILIVGLVVIVLFILVVLGLRVWRIIPKEKLRMPDHSLRSLVGLAAKVNHVARPLNFVGQTRPARLRSAIARRCLHRLFGLVRRSSRASINVTIAASRSETLPACTISCAAAASLSNPTISCSGKNSRAQGQKQWLANGRSVLSGITIERCHVSPQYQQTQWLSHRSAASSNLHKQFMMGSAD
ncbi:hypothetical protein ACFQ3C_18460 [Seohaeicola saemankumensis]|uniref:Uncharacterized protein n=1 Tax=Seohaeicola saemankumensis TaxID=481181 RepID=A0ABW3THL6_9RHOB